MGKMKTLFSKLIPKFKNLAQARVVKSFKGNKRPYILIFGIGLTLAFGFNNCAKVNFRDHAPIESLEYKLTPGIQIVSGAVEATNPQGYRISTSLGHFVDGIEKVTSSGHKVCISFQGEMGCGSWEYKVQYRE